MTYIKKILKIITIFNTVILFQGINCEIKNVYRNFCPIFINNNNK